MRHVICFLAVKISISIYAWPLPNFTQTYLWDRFVMTNLSHWVWDVMTKCCNKSDALLWQNAEIRYINLLTHGAQFTHWEVFVRGQYKTVNSVFIQISSPEEFNPFLKFLYLHSLNFVIYNIRLWSIFKRIKAKVSGFRAPCNRIWIKYSISESFKA